MICLYVLKVRCLYLIKVSCLYLLKVRCLYLIKVSSSTEMGDCVPVQFPVLDIYFGIATQGQLSLPSFWGR